KILIKNYITKCTEAKTMPNMAGFAIYCGTGKSMLEKILEDSPESYDILCSYLEDGALNANAPVSLLTPYLKRYFGYGEKTDGDKDCSGVVVNFPHDIEKDGE
ncbi:MAG: hypothetical protein U0M06_07605, partial [Clostridia bacterium]|nr:hypothetical protein [Clostridia bacterium]